MELIPVVDIQGGLCVHAQKGLRHLYRPLVHFGDGLGTPRSVVAAYLALAPFKTLYLADLDALTGKPAQWALIESLAENFPELRFWVDAGGLIAPPSLRRRITQVIGSESLPQGLDEALGEDVILSLDYRDETLMGSEEILSQQDRWPHRVILMSLSLVGGLGGPDFHRLRAFRSAHRDTQLYAAGGIRHREDLEALAALGVSGALLATALQSRQLDGLGLEGFEWSTDLQA